MRDQRENKSLMSASASNNV